MQNHFRNACIAVTGSLAAAGAAHAEGGMAAAAATALDGAQADVMATGPKVLLVVAAVVSVGIMIALFRKA
jgi:hypothetical protein